MSLRKLTKSALKSIDEISSRELQFAAIVCIVIAALNALVYIYGLGYLNGQNIACGCHGLPPNYSYDFMRLKIEAALLVIAFALRFRTILGFFASVLATVLIEIQYALWYLDTQRWLRDLKLTDFSQLKDAGLVPHFAGIYQATPWDFVLFVFTSALFVWQIRVFIALIISARQRKNHPDPLI